MHQTIAGMSIGPPHIQSRLRQMFHEPPPQAATQLRSVLASTLAIVEARFPQLDPKHTSWAHYGLEQATQGV